MHEGNGTFDFGFGSLPRLSSAATRSLSAENPTGEKGRGGMATEGTGAEAASELGRGWKVSPSIGLRANSEVTVADIAGPGVIQHIWLTVAPSFWRRLVLRFFWDDEETPSVEVPLGDFFCNGWGSYCHVNSLPVAVNPNGGFNSYWPMPFRRRARISVANVSSDDVGALYYQIDYSLTHVPSNLGYFHAQWRHSSPVAFKTPHTIVDEVEGQGHYVGTYIAWGANDSQWWGEGEIKFYLDGDAEWPTICGTGTEDYFGGAWNFEYPPGEYRTFTTPFLGLAQALKPDGPDPGQQHFGMYRWHIPDPIRFQKDLRVTIQALGWRSTSEGKPRFLPLQDDIASTAFWYQEEPHKPFRDELKLAGPGPL
jgi:hypothetical protein